MKKVLLLVALMAASSASFAQKSLLNKAKLALQEATAGQKNVDETKLGEVMTMLETCMKDPVSGVLGETYSTAGRVQAYYMQNMLNKRSVGEEMDMDKFFDLQGKIVDLYSQAYKFDHTPNAKGKYVLKPEEMQNNTKFYQQIAGGPRSNLFIAASNLVNSDPDRCIMFVDKFEKTFSDPLFEGVVDASLDSSRVDATYFKAAALKSKAKTAADSTALIPMLEKSLASKNYAVMACNDLMEIYKQRGQMDKWCEICDKGMAIDPSQKFFPKVKLEYLSNEKKFDEAKALCKVLKERYPDDDYAFYTEGVMFFQDNKYAEAVEAFKAAAAVTGTNAEAWSSAGTATWKIAMDNRTKTDVCTKYINEAVGYFKKAEELAPENPRLWGYFLYQAYTSLKKPADAKKYVQYKDL
ncbi:MAG: hypothetical protein KBS99_07340 [Prevotellaceae bacterium]|nr:hypothetical protein [Candidatus Colivivens caballi]